jgi:hypothetical protein
MRFRYYFYTSSKSLTRLQQPVKKSCICSKSNSSKFSRTKFIFHKHTGRNKFSLKNEISSWHMPKKKDNIQIIGTQGGICGYVDRDQVVYRAESSLTGKRTKIDPAFAGFRKSSNRMKEAVPIASALYGQLSKEQKQFGLFRIMTGEVILMLKEGIDKTEIRETLFKRHIEPILAGHEYKIPLTIMRRSKPPLPGYTCIGHVDGFPRLKIWRAPDAPVQAPDDEPGQAPDQEPVKSQKGIGNTKPLLMLQGRIILVIRFALSGCNEFKKTFRYIMGPALGTVFKTFFPGPETNMGHINPGLS